MKIDCPECKTENEIEFYDSNSESQSVKCVSCNLQFVATNDGNSEIQATLQDMSGGDTLTAETAEVGQVLDLGQEQETFEEEPDNIENMLDQMLEDDAPEASVDFVEGISGSAETGGDAIDTYSNGQEPEIEEVPEDVKDPEATEDIISTSPGEDNLENILEGVLGDTSYDESSSQVEDASEIIGDEKENVETFSAPSGGDDLDSILDGMLTDKSFGGVDNDVKDAPEVVADPNEVVEEAPQPSEEDLDNVLDGMLNSDFGVEDVLGSGVEDAPEVVADPNQEEVSEPPSEEDLDNILEGMNQNTDLNAADSQAEEASEVLGNDPPNEIESEQPVEVAAEPLSEKTTETNQNSDMETISPETSEKVDNVNEDIEEPEEVEESEEDILTSLKEEMGLDDLFRDDEDDTDETESKPDGKIDEQTEVEPEDAVEEPELPAPTPELTEDELPQVEAKSESSDEIDTIKNASEEINEQDDIERMLEENIQEELEAAQETSQDLKEENTIVEEKLDEIWDDTVNNSKEVTEEPKENSKTNSEDHTVAEEKPEESEDDLWEQAFAEQDEINKEKEPEGVEEVDTVDTAQEDASQAAPEEDEAAMAVAEDVSEAPEDDLDATGGIREEDYEDDEDKADAEEEDEPRRKIGPIPIPSSTLGKALMGASLAAVLITAGGFYFGIQAFMPEEVAKYIPFLKKEVPEEGAAFKGEGIFESGEEADPNQTEEASPDTLNLGMEGEDISESPKEESGETKSAETPSESGLAPEKPTQEEQTEAASPSDATEPANQDPQVQKEEPVPAETEKLKEKEKPLALGSEENLSEEAKDVTKALQAALGDKGETLVDPDSGLLEALSSTEKTIMFGTIMPVAYNINDIRVLSFDLQVELDNEKTAKLIREALPVYQKIMIDTVEKFLEKKFYNDILYVKEKLQRQLLKNFNKSIRGGRVKKAKFKEFTIQ